MKIKDKKNISIIIQTLAEHQKLFSKIDSKIIKEINTISKVILRSLFNKNYKNSRGGKDYRKYPKRYKCGIGK